MTTGPLENNVLISAVAVTDAIHIFTGYVGCDPSPWKAHAFPQNKTKLAVINNAFFTFTLQFLQFCSPENPVSLNDLGGEFNRLPKPPQPRAVNSVLPETLLRRLDLHNRIVKFLLALKKNKHEIGPGFRFQHLLYAMTSDQIIFVIGFVYGKIYRPIVL